MRTVYTPGGLAIVDDKILLVKQPTGLVLPKGHMEAGETKEQTVVRELLEETGYQVAIVAPLGSLRRPSTESSGEAVSKVIDVFLVTPLQHTDQPTDEDSTWVPLAEAPALMAHPAERDFLVDYLAKH